MSVKDEASMPVAAHFVAASVLGLLVGVLAGLSVAPVVSTLLGALAAGAMVFLGLRGKLFAVKQSLEHQPATDASPIAEAPVSAPRQDVLLVTRIIGFAGFATAGALCGIYLRAHDALTPSIGRQVQEWVDAGFSTDEAKTIVRYNRTGLLPAGPGALAVTASTQPSASPDGRVGDVRPTSTLLYGGGGADPCSKLDPSKYADTALVLRAYKEDPDPYWRNVADLVEKYAPPEHQDAVLQFVWKVHCGK